MLLYCLRSRRNTKGKNRKVLKTNNRRIMFLLKCAVCGSKKSRFIKEQEAGGFGFWGNILSAPFIFKLLETTEEFSW